MLAALHQLRDQFAALFGPMKTAQKITLVVLGLTVLAPFVYLMTSGSESADFEPLQWGATYDPEVLRTAEQALVDRGLDDFKTVGHKLLAPKSKVREYNAALASAGITSTKAADPWEQDLNKLSVFTPRDHLEAREEHTRRKQVLAMLRDIDGIKDAELIWARSKNNSRWPNGPGVTATVRVTPKPGRELSDKLVETVRNCVSGSIPDLKREGVTVVDVSTGRSFRGDDVAGQLDSKLQQQKERVVHDFQSKISWALKHIPEVVVSVNVDFVQPRSARERKPVKNNHATLVRTNGTSSNQPRDLSPTTPQLEATDAESFDTAPTSVRVAVSIPDDYCEKVVIRDGIKPGTTEPEKVEFREALEVVRTREIGKVKQTVAMLLPAGSTPDSISVATHATVAIGATPFDVPVTDTVESVVGNWGSSLGLVAFACWTFWMLKKSLPATTTAFGCLIKTAEPEPSRSPPSAATDLSAATDSHSFELADRLLAESLDASATNSGPVSVREPIESVPFEFLQHIKGDHLFAYLAEEHPQTIALVLSYLPTNLAADVLGELSPEKQLDVVRRIAQIDHTNSEVVRDIEASLKLRVAQEGRGLSA